jgi:formylmethanofuran dehydrogenase subunit E
VTLRDPEGPRMDDRIRQAIDFHGHLCAGLTMGVRAARVALREVGPHAADEEVVAIVETDMCAVDAIQFLTGCTFGKGNLIHRDVGKNAYTFIRRSDGKAIRVVTRPDGWPPHDPERGALREKVRAGTATEAEERRYEKLRDERALAVLDVPEERLFDVQEVRVQAPRPARVHASIPCADCGEMTMETRIRRSDGRNLCIPCFEHAEAR